MFDLVTKHKRIAQVILALIALPFAFFGVDFYFRRAEGPPSVATVGGDKVTQAEFDELMRDQQARMRQMLGRQYDPAMFDSAEAMAESEGSEAWATMRACSGDIIERFGVELRVESGEYEEGTPSA